MATPPGAGFGSLTMYLGVPREAVVEKWMHWVDSVVLASLVHPLENTLEGLREHVAAVL